MGVKSGTVRKMLARGAVASLLVLPAANVAAMDTFFAGPRAMGMGGANVASVNDTTAQYYNPAALGFFNGQDKDGKRLASDNNNLGRKKWGVDVNAAAGYRLHNEFGGYLDELADIDPGQLSADIQDESDLADLINLVRNLRGLDDPGNAITADATAGLGIRYGHFAIGGRAFMQAAGRVLNVDEQNLGLTGISGNLNTEINGITPTGFDSQVALFTTEQQAQLVAAGLDAAAIQRLDFIARQEGITQTELQGTVDLLAILAGQTTGAITGGSLDDNTTAVLLQGFGVAEVPLSYGYAINDTISIGANLKLMQGRVYGSQVLVFDDNADEVLKETDEKYEETTTFGVDLGVMARFPYVNLGVVGRNLNSPKFDGFTDTVVLSNGRTVALDVDDVTLDPQVTAGAAFIPFQTLTFEIDYDLTKNETAFPGYDTQNLSFGLEWDAFRFLALRAGAFKNLAENDIDWVYTAGLGLNLWAVRLDVAGAFSTEKEEFDGDEIPSETRVAAQLSVDF